MPKLLPHEIVREAMRKENLTFRDIALKLGERPDKLSVAVRCTNGTGRRSIELREKVAALLSLEPLEIWDSSVMSERQPRKTKGNTRPVKASEVSEEAWAELEPRERIRAMVTDRGETLRDLADLLGLPYSSMTAAIYGNSNSTIRMRIAEYFGKSVHSIWPELHPIVPPAKPLSVAITENPDLQKFFGFGDLTIPFDPNPSGQCRV